MNWQIKQWNEAALPGMLEIWNEVVRAGQAFPQEEELDLQNGAIFFNSQSYCGVALNDNGEVLGLYILHPNNIGRCGHICNASYAVKSCQRGQGIGKALVLHSLAMARKLGFRVMQFNAVAADNAAANRLYQNLGFKQLGCVPGGFRKPTGVMVDINLYCFPLSKL